MVSSNVFFERATIESFRGFCEKIELDLNAPVVVFAGPNGTGKTSVFDALQWVLLGSLDRLEKLRTRRTVEHVVSVYRDGGEAAVEIDMVIGGAQVSLRRTGDHNGSVVEVVGTEQGSLSGDRAESWIARTLCPSEPSALHAALVTCGLLQQDVIRSVLESAPEERYSQISTLLGLSELENFERAASEAVKASASDRKNAEIAEEGARRTAEQAAAILEAAEKRFSHLASIEVATTSLREAIARVPAALVVRVPDALSAEDAVARAQVARSLRRRIDELQISMAELDQQRQRLDPEPTNGQVDDLEAVLSDLEEKHAAAETQLLAAEDLLTATHTASQQIARLAAAAIPLLSNECPVCGQAIDAGEVESHLAERASESPILITQMRAAETARKDLDMCASDVRAARDELESARGLLQAWANLRDSERRLEDDISELTAAGDDGLALQELTGTVVREFGKPLVSALDGLAALFEHYGDAARSPEASREVNHARSQLSRAQAEYETCQASTSRLRSVASDLKKLAETSTLARVDITTARFTDIEPLVADIYRRLDPHPAFKRIGFRHDTYYRKGRSFPVVTDIAEEIEADPLIVFSTSQANIAALSCFLAMSIGAGERALPFVLLDDPLQSMDDINVLGFADLCRFLKSRRQLIISTHDRRFANLLRRKLAPRAEQDRTILHTFKSWDRSGPSIETEFLDFTERDAALHLGGSAA